MGHWLGSCEIIATSLSGIPNHMPCPILRKSSPPKLFCLSNFFENHRNGKRDHEATQISVAALQSACRFSVKPSSYRWHIVSTQSTAQSCASPLPCSWNTIFEIYVSEVVSSQLEFLSGERACGLKASEDHQTAFVRGQIRLEQ